MMRKIIGHYSRVQTKLIYLVRLIRKTLTIFLPSVLKQEITWSDYKTYCRPWYHDFSALGFSTPQNPIRTYAVNQFIKQGVLFPWIKEAIFSLERSDCSGRLRILEYFSADSYYGLYLLNLDVATCDLFAIDLGNQSGEGKSRSYVLDQGALAARALGLEEYFHQINDSVFDIDIACDLLLNIGGLYHVDNVVELISKSVASGAKIMIIQTVVHEDENRDSFYISPAPNWTWGSRFSKNWLKQQVLNSGWDIEKESFNLLTHNEDPMDRGSYYLYCVRSS
jgi:hypothetical protein